MFPGQYVWRDIRVFGARPPVDFEPCREDQKIKFKRTFWGVDG